MFLPFFSFGFSKGKKQAQKAEKISKDPIGDLYKQLENAYEQRIPGYKGIMFRMDGRGFSKFTKQFPKKDCPFNVDFVNAMIRTANSTFLEFNAATVFVISDEISIWFPPKCTKQEYDSWNDPKRQRPEHSSNGRVEKLTTTIASFCTGQFIRFFSDEIKNKPGYDRYPFERICRASFDARAFTLNNTQVHQYFWWRSVKDGYRNSVSTFARSLYSHKELHKKSNEDMIKMMEKYKGNKKAIDWKEVPKHLKYGVFGKKKLVNIISTNKQTGKTEKSKRVKVINSTFQIPELIDIDKFSAFFSEKYMNQLPSPPNFVK